MKTTVILSTLMFFSNGLLSQKNFQMGQDFLDLAQSKGGTTGGLSAFQNYSSTDIDGSQFFLPSWSAGEVITIRKEAFNTEFEFLYDKVRQELFIKQKDSSLVLLTNKDEVESFSLKDGDSTYYFVNSKLFTDDRPEIFYQVLVYDSVGISLLKYYKTSLVKADLSNLTNQRQGKVYDAFVDKIYYYIAYRGIELKAVELKLKSIRKTFLELNIQVDPYLNSNLQPVSEMHLVNLVKYINRTNK